MNEIQIQAKAYQWMWNHWHEIRRKLFHVPNGGKRSKIEANQLKASGVVAGVPDMLLVWKGGVYAWEVKCKETDGYVRKSQKEVHEAWKEEDVDVVIVWTAEELCAEVGKVIGREFNGF